MKFHAPLLLLGLFSSSLALANTVITFSPGLAFGKNGTTQTVQIQTTPQSLSNQYVANRDWHTAFAAGLSVGTDVYTNNRFDLQLGASLGYTSAIKQSGMVNQLASPTFDTLNYKYNVNSFTAMGDATLFYLKSKTWQPYIDVRLGYANNVTSSYQETPRITGAVPMTPFGSKGTNNFAYGLGVGLMMKLSHLFSIGVGYQFEDLGCAALGLSPGQTSTSTPRVKHIYLNEALIHLSWTI
jgi:opacity protein-like surface antigen